MKQSIVYKIPYQEWKILMACGNVKQMYGLTFEEHAVSKRSMLFLLHDMVQKGMICIEEERLKPRGKYKELLDMVTEAEQFLALKYVQNDSWKRGSLYLAERLLWVQNSDCRKETYEMTLISKCDWEEWMLEQKFFPCYRSQPLRQIWQETEKAEIEETCFEAKICKVRNGESNRKIVIYEKWEKEYLRREVSEQYFYMTYHQEYLLKELENWLENGKEMA